MRKKYSSIYRQAGFTFLEVVLAIGILVVIMSVAYGALAQIIRAKKLLDDSRDAKAIADAIIQRFSRELQLISTTAPSLINCKLAKKAPYPGDPKIYGTSQTGPDGVALNSIEFAAQNAGQFVPDGGTHTGSVTISYRAEKDPENPQSETYLLIRDEIPAETSVDRACQKIMTFPVTKNLLSLRFRYYSSDDSAWYDSWGSPARRGLPKIVKFAFKIKSPLGTISDYESSVFIPS